MPYADSFSTGGTISNTSRITDAMNGMIITDRMIPAVRMPMPLGAPWNSAPITGTLAERGGQQRLHVVAEQRREHEQPPHAVDDRRDRREQLDGRAQRPLQRRRAHLGQEQRDAEAHRHADEQRDERRDQRAVDRREAAELCW